MPLYLPFLTSLIQSQVILYLIAITQYIALIRLLNLLILRLLIIIKRRILNPYA